MVHFRLKYFIPFLILLFLEILIAKYATGFIRNTFGDFLCVILLYTFFQSLKKLPVLHTALAVLIIAYFIELLQLTNLKNLYPQKIAKTLQIVLGTAFSIGDLIAYTLGIITTYIIEFKLQK